jgi:mannonate dehydratase
MDRRTFFSVTAASAAAVPGTAAPRKATAGPPPLKARLGHQMNGKLTEANCKWASRYGLEALCASPDIKDPERLYPTIEELNQMLGLADKYKLKVEIIDSPLLQSTYIDREKHAAIMLGQSPERDHEIEAIQTTLKNCAAVGIRTLKYISASWACHATPKRCRGAATPSTASGISKRRWPRTGR